MTRIYILLAVWYLIGALSIALINYRRHDGDARQRWIKLMMYIALTLSLTTALLFAPLLAMGASVVIVLAGFYELQKLEGLRGIRRPLVILAYCIVAILFSLFIWRSRHDQLPCLVYLTVLSFDGFSQVCGQLIGGVRIAPKISPGKTYSGLIGGTLMGVVTAGMVSAPWITDVWLLALIVCFLAFSGDMLASAVKRIAGVKDYSSIIPGHGGMLDRFDSFLFAGAVIECYFRLT
jgi:phosphatidate cytidylyltransferase